MRRVVVTGMGAVSPLGNDLATTWDGLVAGKSGIDFIQGFDTSDYPVKVGAEVKDFDPTGLASPKDLRKLARFTQFSLAAASEAVESAGLLGAYPPERVGVVLGSAVGDIGTISQQERTLLERGPSRVAPWFIPSILTDAPSGQLAIAFGFSGINFAMVAACATGSYTLGEGAEIVRRGAADAVLAGGAEAALTPLILAGFSNMRGLATEQEYPPRASRPFDATRDGFVIGEGAGILVLEELEAARARGATIHAEIVSYGASNDAFHIAQPDPEAGGVARMMSEALAAGGIEPEQVGYINAHGTSTPLGDAAETKAIKAAFGDHAYKLAVSSTKSMLGHCLGAAGALEAIACVLAIEHGIIPPTINYETPDPDCDLDYVPNEARKADLSYAISNGMGLGGHNGCVLVGRVD
ncbi:MAG: beta-ketoacyl-ACP synthase II [Gaiellaceae bacterium]